MGYLDYDLVTETDRQLQMLSMRVNIIPKRPEDAMEDDEDIMHNWQYSVTYQCQDYVDLDTVSNVNLDDTFGSGSVNVNAGNISFNGSAKMAVRVSLPLAKWVTSTDTIVPLELNGSKFMRSTVNSFATTETQPFNWDAEVDDSKMTVTSAKHCLKSSFTSIECNTETKDITNSYLAVKAEYRTIGRVIAEVKHYDCTAITGLNGGLGKAASISGSCNGSPTVTIGSGTLPSFILVAQEFTPWGIAGSQIILERREYVTYGEWKSLDLN